MSLLALGLAVAVEKKSQRLDVVVEAELAHRVEDVFGSDGLALLALTALVGFARDEADVLRHAFLDGFLRVVRDFRVGREDFAHYADYVRDRHVAVLFADCAFDFFWSEAGGVGYLQA